MLEILRSGLEARGRRIAPQFGALIGALIRLWGGLNLGAFVFEYRLDTDHAGGESGCAYAAEECTSI